MSEATQAVVVTAIPMELEKAVAETGLAADGVQSLKDGFAPHFIEFHTLAEEAKAITVTQPKAARDMRLALKRVRVDAEKTRKAMKEDSLRRGKAIDGINSLLVYQLTPVEEAMDAIEKAEEIAEANRKAALQSMRADDLSPYADPTFYDLGSMPEDQWTQLIAGAKAAHDAKIAAAAKAEAERIEAERLAAEAEAKRKAEEAAERERMRAENERLAKEAEAARKAKEEAERIAAAERAEAEAKAAAEREAARKEREAIEAKARKEREALEANAKAEREEAARLARIEREKREAIEAEQQAKADAEAKRIASEKAIAKRAAAAPDKRKVVVFAESVRNMAVPEMTTDAGRALAQTIASQRNKFADWLESEAKKLEGN